VLRSLLSPSRLEPCSAPTVAATAVAAAAAFALLASRLTQLVALVFEA